MNAERLLENYDRIADAPDAVARLRRFVLDLAVRGKLVPQDPKDEPAAELLKRIAAEKARLIKAGDLRKPRERNDEGELNAPFAIPSTWRWIRLDAVGSIVGGGTPPSGDADNFAAPGDGIPWLTPADLGGYAELYISRGARDLSEKGGRNSSATVLPAGTVLFTSRAPIGYIAIAANPLSTNQGFKSIVPYVGDCSRFIATAMKAFAPEIDARAPGTTFKEVSGRIVAAIPFPLPPLAEQHRIVAKVDELMALCDRLEAARTEREAARDRLAAASLARLNAPDPGTFKADARFALDALPALTARPDQVKQLRQTILNLAVRGKLVPQDSGDEPATDLLKRIASEKTKIPRKERMRGPASNRSTVSDTGIALPPGWGRVPLVELVTVINGRAYKQSELLGAGTPVLRVGNLFTSDKWYYSDLQLDDDKYCEKGDLIFAWSASFGPFIWGGGRAIYHYHIWKLELHSKTDLDKKYLYNFLLQKTREIKDAGHGISMIHMTKEKMELIEVPVPPLAEQHRIVAKVDELMALCDRLEVGLAAGEDGRRRLLDALLHEALEQAAVLEEAA